nr:putative ribonuclease H-like domain-containing protein [Tanacetum cinerariifolium]
MKHQDESIHNNTSNEDETPIVETEINKKSLTSDWSRPPGFEHFKNTENKPIDSSLHSKLCFQDKFDAEKAGEESDQQYVLFPVWSSGSTNPQNTDEDAAFDAKKPEYEVIISPSSNAQSKKQDNKTKREVNATGTQVPAVGKISPNSTNTFSDVGPSNAAASSTHGKSSCIVASQLLDDPNMPELEDITYYDNVGAKADFNNLETSITVSPIPTTRVHKDQPVTQIIGDLSSATQTRSMTMVAKDQGGLSQVFNDDFHTCMFACFLSEEEPKRVHQALKDPSWTEAIQEELLQLKMQKVWVLVDLPYGKRDIDGKSASTLIDTEKPLLKDPDGVNTPRCDEDRLELMALMAFLLPNVEKVRIGVSVVDLQVFAIRLMLLLLVQKLLLFGLTNWYCLLSAIRTLEFVETHNMVAYLSKSDACEGFHQIIDFLNRSSIKYALTVNPNIYVLCIKQFWTTVAVKKVNDIIRLQALVDKKKVGVTKATIQEVLCLDDAEGVECLPKEEIFAELAKMGYEKPSTKLTFYKAFFSIRWKFLIHTILQGMSAKRTSWNEFSSSMASVSYAYLQLIIRKQVGDLSTYTTKYTSPALTQKVFTNMRRVGKGFFGVETPLFKGMLVAQEVGEGVADEEHDEGVPAAGDIAKGDVSAAHDEVPTGAEKPSIPSPTPPTPPPHPSQDTPSTSQRVETSDETMMDDVSNQGSMIAEMDQDADVVLEDDEEEDKSEPAEVQEVVDVVTTAKIITKVVTASSETISAASITIAAAEAQVPAFTLTAAPARVTVAPSRRRKGVVIRDPQEGSTTSTIILAETKSKDKGKRILVEEPKPLKKQAQIEQDEKYARELKAELNRIIDWDEVIDHVNRKAKEDKSKAKKRQKLDDEVEELKRDLQIVPNDDDDVYTEATPLAHKVPVIDYEIIEQNNKPYYKIIRVDARYSCSNLEESKKCTWSSKSQGLEAVGFLCWVNKRQMQTTKEKVDTSKALDASLVDIKSCRTESKEQDTSSRPRNDACADDADIRPIYNEEPMAE